MTEGPASPHVLGGHVEPRVPASFCAPTESTVLGVLCPSPAPHGEVRPSATETAALEVL